MAVGIFLDSQLSNSRTFVINVGGSCGEGYAPGILFDSISKSICLQY